MCIVNDCLMGWIIIMVIRFLTAIATFLIVRSEQWLFNIKYRYYMAGNQLQDRYL